MVETNILPEYHCSKCGTRINKEDTKCPNCGAILDTVHLEDDEMSVELKKYEDHFEAEMAERALKDEGIDCFLSGRVDWTMTLAYKTYPVTLVVLEKDAARALEILEGK